MKRKVVFISEALSTPFDEGIKNVAVSLCRELGMRVQLFSVTKRENRTDGLEVVNKIDLNKLFMNYELAKFLITCSPDIILYLPEASYTFNSFLRAKVLKLMSGKSKVVMLGMQHREYSSLKDLVIRRFLRPNLLMLLGKPHKEFFIERGLRVQILPPAVDSVKFCPAKEDEKKRVRAEYGIPYNKTVVLHVGHIKKSRNIECLIDIQKIDNLQVVVVGSTSYGKDSVLKHKLLAEGICVIDKNIPDISKIYKMSDIYVFPVIDIKAAIDMPLSVLEALACNLPVITTRFGGLVENFKEDRWYRYFDNTDDLISLIKQFKNSKGGEISNKNKIDNFTWGNFSGEVLSACEDLL